MNEDQLEKEVVKLDQKVSKKQKVLAFTNDIDIFDQLKQINELDM